MKKRVLIVEDQPLIAMHLDTTLENAGLEVCGIAASRKEAISLGRETSPDMAVVDVRLDPDDGRKVARELADSFDTVVLMATSESPDALNGIGAIGVLPKPYRDEDVISALDAAEKIAAGQDPGGLPDHMKLLARD